MNDLDIEPAERRIEMTVEEIFDQPIKKEEKIATCIKLVATASRDGIQNIKIPELKKEECTEIMKEKVKQYVLTCVEGGIRTFDLGSIVDTKYVPTMADLKVWMKDMREAVEEKFSAEIAAEIDFQFLIFTDEKSHGFFDKARELKEAGILTSLAYVHSHDHRFLGQNHIRKVGGERMIPKEVQDKKTGESREPTYDEIMEALDANKKAILEESRRRYEAIKKLAEELGVPLNIYFSNATGSRDEHENPMPLSFSDQELVVDEIQRIAMLGILPGSRIIPSDTQSIADAELAKSLSGKIAEFLKSLSIISDITDETKETLLECIGIHPHVSTTATPTEVIDTVKEFLKPFIGVVKEIKLDIGFAELGGCIILKKPEKTMNLPFWPAIQALEDMQKEDPSIKIHEPDMAELFKADRIVKDWKTQLKALSE